MDCRRSWHIGKRASVRSAEAQRAVSLSFDVIALFVDGAAMAAT
jgi:hypothetical protein